MDGLGDEDTGQADGSGGIAGEASGANGGTHEQGRRGDLPGGGEGERAATKVGERPGERGIRRGQSPPGDQQEQGEAQGQQERGRTTPRVPGGSGRDATEIGGQGARIGAIDVTEDALDAVGSGVQLHLKVGGLSRVVRSAVGGGADYDGQPGVLAETAWLGTRPNETACLERDRFGEVG